MNQLEFKAVCRAIRYFMADADERGRDGWEDGMNILDKLRNNYLLNRKRKGVKHGAGKDGN